VVATGQFNELPLGESPGASDPIAQAERQAHRRFQLHVLYVFVGTMIAIVLLDMIYRKYIDVTSSAGILERLLATIAPIFTFLLGMGTRPS
jgi:hypothetical protein